MTLTSIVVKVYNASQLYETWNWENSLEKSELFSEKTIDNIIDSDNPLNHQKSSCKKISFVDFCKAFDSILRGKILFTNPSARAGYDTRSIFKRSLTGLNSEFSFS